MRLLRLPGHTALAWHASRLVSFHLLHTVPSALHQACMWCACNQRHLRRTSMGLLKPVRWLGKLFQRSTSPRAGPLTSSTIQAPRIAAFPPSSHKALRRLVSHASFLECRQGERYTLTQSRKDLEERAEFLSIRYCKDHSIQRTASCCIRDAACKKHLDRPPPVHPFQCSGQRAIWRGHCHPQPQSQERQ